MNQNKFDQFRALHRPGQPLVMPNPWDAGSAKLFANLGFSALATTSAGLAYSMGRPDGSDLTNLDLLLANAEAIVHAVDLPVSADLENGMGDMPQDCADCIHRAVDIGLSGGSIEDVGGLPDRKIYEHSLAVERIEAASSMAKRSGFVLTARAENFLYGNPDLDDTIARLTAYARAGADVLYAPGLRNLQEISEVCQAVDKPINVVMGLAGAAFSVSELAGAGVARISTGGSLARYAYGKAMDAASDILGKGSFGYAKYAIGDAEINQRFKI